LRRFFWVRIFALFVVAAVAIMAGCPTTNTGILPSTGVDIDIGDLLMQGNLTCGNEGGADVYKYAGIVSFADFGKYPKGVVPLDMCTFPNVAGGIFDCFSAGAFGNLPLQGGGALPDGGTETYSVQIFFFTPEVYNRPGMANDIACAVTVSPSGNGNCAKNLCHLDWEWATTCTAIEEDNVVVNASCSNLVRNPRNSAAPDAKGDSPAKDAPGDSPETSSDAPTDAPADGSGDVKGDVTGDAPPG
jgi:hypothetical protein